MDDPRDPLSTVLQSWKHEPTPAPDFRRAVWRRIDRSHTTQPHGWASILHFPSAMPLAASITLLLSIAAGSSTALALRPTQTAERMAVAYAISIDPVQMTAASSHNHP